MILFCSPPCNVTKETKQSHRPVISWWVRKIMSCPHTLSHRSVLWDMPVSAGIGAFDGSSSSHTHFTDLQRPVRKIDNKWNIRKSLREVLSNGCPFCEDLIISDSWLSTRLFTHLLAFQQVTLLKELMEHLGLSLREGSSLRGYSAKSNKETWWCWAHQAF